MKIFHALAALLALSACVSQMPQGKCGDGYVQHTSPAGTERCIKPGMAMGDGVMNAIIAVGAGAALANSGLAKPF